MGWQRFIEITFRCLQKAGRTVNSACKINCYRRYFQIVTNILHLPSGFERVWLLLMCFITVFKRIYLTYTLKCANKAKENLILFSVERIMSVHVSSTVPFSGLHPEVMLTQQEEAIVCRNLYVHGGFFIPLDSVYPIKVQHAHVHLPQFICTGIAFRVLRCRVETQPLFSSGPISCTTL